MMLRGRLPFLALLAAALAAWWVADHHLTPWFQAVAGSARIPHNDLSVVLGHLLDQLPRVLLCVAIWLVGSRIGLMPSLRDSLRSGGSWRRVLVTGLIATVLLLVVTLGIGAAAGGTFGFFPYFPKMAGDL